MSIKSLVRRGIFGAGCSRVKSGDGVKVAAASWSGDTDKTLMFVHGWSQSSVVWRKQIEALSEKFNIIVYDLRGHGESERPTNVSAYEERWAHAGDVDAVMAHFGVERLDAIVGWSFGATIAADAAIRLGRSRIKSAVLVSGTPNGATEETQSYFGPLMAETAALVEGPRGKRERAAITKFLKESYLYGQWDSRLYKDVFRANASLTPAQRALVATRPSYNNIEALNDIGTPMLLIHGALDPVFVADASITAGAQLNNAMLRIYSDTGHWPFLEREREFNRDLNAFFCDVLSVNNGAGERRS